MLISVVGASLESEAEPTSPLHSLVCSHSTPSKTVAENNGECRMFHARIIDDNMIVSRAIEDRLSGFRSVWIISARTEVIGTLPPTLPSP